MVSALVVLIGAGVSRRASPFTGDRRGIGWFVGIGLCNGAAVLTLYAALARGPVAVVAPLVACYPLVTLALTGFCRGGVAITRRLVAGVIVTVAGVALLLAA